MATDAKIKPFAAAHLTANEGFEVAKSAALTKTLVSKTTPTSVRLLQQFRQLLFRQTIGRGLGGHLVHGFQQSLDA